MARSRKKSQAVSQNKTAAGPAATAGDTAPSDSAVFRLLQAVITLVALASIIVLLRLVFIRSYNFDELLHAHLTWLVATGERPYRDFAVNHFPFLWMAVAPVIRLLPESPSALEFLRALALLWNGIFVVSLAALICAELQPREKPWALACLGLVVLSPAVTPYLIEYRPDPLGNALLFFGLVLFRFKGARPRHVFLGAFLVGGAVLTNTKCIFFPLVLCFMAVLVWGRRYRELWRPAVAAISGFAFVLLVGAGSMAVMGMPLDGAYRMVILYNAAIEKLHTQGFGLALAVARHPFGVLYATTGLAVFIYLLLRKRTRLSLLSVAILGFLVVNLVLNTRPWKQYYVPWLLLAGFLPARSLPVLLARLGARLQLAAVLCIALIAAIEVARTSSADPDRTTNRAEQDQTMAWMLQHVPRDGFVLCTFDHHPIFRRDTFFKTDIDLMDDGHDAIEKFMPQFFEGAIAEHFTLPGYERELETHPPAIMVPHSCTETQGHALEAFLNRHNADYEPVTIPGTDFLVLQQRHAGN